MADNYNSCHFHSWWDVRIADIIQIGNFRRCNSKERWRILSPCQTTSRHQIMHWFCMSCQTGVGPSTSIMYRLLKPICLFADLWYFDHTKIRQCLFTIQPAFIVSKEILNSVDCKYYSYLVRHFITAFIDKKTELM